MKLSPELWCNASGLIIGLFVQCSLRFAAWRGSIESETVTLWTNFLLLGLLVPTALAEFTLQLQGEESLQKMAVILKELLFPIYAVQLIAHVIANLRYFRRARR